MTTLATTEDIWLDPETWGPPGLSCRWCQTQSPIAHSICRPCWIRRFLGRLDIGLWIMRQDEAYVRQEERQEAQRKYYGHEGRAGIIRYAEKYGVWLVPEKQM